MPEGLPSGCMPEGVADSGFKRAASPAPGSNPDMSDGWRALAQPLSSEPEQKRAKLTRGDKRKAQGVRKANADETVLDAVELFLRSVWLEGHPEAEASSVPKTFGWSETSKQGEAEFCRAAPIPAKLAGGAEADCEFD
ncbi:hypothetical protein GGI10_003894, partial [Coemansia sp. RSA 2530]